MPRRNLHAPVRASSALQREFPQMDRRATEVLINLIRTDSLVTTALSRRFRHHGLSLSGFNALVILRQAPEGVNPHEIADRLLVTRAAVTGILDALGQRVFRTGPLGTSQVAKLCNNILTATIMIANAEALTGRENQSSSSQAGANCAKHPVGLRANGLSARRE